MAIPRFLHPAADKTFVPGLLVLTGQSIQVGLKTSTAMQSSKAELMDKPKVEYVDRVEQIS